MTHTDLDGDAGVCLLTFVLAVQRIHPPQPHQPHEEQDGPHDLHEEPSLEQPHSSSVSLPLQGKVCVRVCVESHPLPPADGPVLPQQQSDLLP